MLKNNIANNNFNSPNERLRDNENVAMLAIIDNPLNFKYISERLKDNDYLAFLALTNDIEYFDIVFNCISNRLKNDKNFFLYILEFQPIIFQYLPEILKEDKDIIEKATTKEISNYFFIPKKYKNDSKFLFHLLKITYETTKDPLILSNIIPNKLRKKRNFFLDLIGISENFFQVSSLLSNPLFVNAAMKRNIKIVNKIPLHIYRKENKEINRFYTYSPRIYIFLEDDNLIISYINCFYKGEIEYNIIKYLDYEVRKVMKENIKTINREIISKCLFSKALFKEFFLCYNRLMKNYLPDLCFEEIIKNIWYIHFYRTMFTNYKKLKRKPNNTKQSKNKRRKLNNSIQL